MDAEWHSPGYQKDLLISSHLPITMLDDTYDTSEEDALFRPDRCVIAYWTGTRKVDIDNQLRPILYRGDLDLAVYNRAELKSSDHRPVFAFVLETVVWIVIGAKRDALAGSCWENVTSTAANEKLDEKLAGLTLRPSTNRTVSDSTRSQCLAISEII